MESQKPNVVDVSESMDINSIKQVRNNAMRDQETVTDEMLKEVRELIKAFNLPFIVAPAEAEAQCAELEKVNNP